MSCHDPTLNVRKTMCKTCPWRKDSPFRALKDQLSESGMKVGRICHSTGESAIYPDGTGIEPHICAGSRAEQLQFMHQLGMIDEPTHEAWNRKCRELGLPERIIGDPEDAHLVPPEGSLS